MNLTTGTTLKSVEKLFGPALPGIGDSHKTVSAMRYAAGKGKKFAGVPGIQPDAAFHIHFPLNVDLSQIKSKKGAIDFISDLKEDGPQSKQGRREEVDTFVRKHQQEAFLANLGGTKTVAIEIDGHRFSPQAKITFSKKNRKLKLTAEWTVL